METCLFEQRHIGADEAEIRAMLKEINAGSLDELIDQTVPASIRLRTPLQLPEPLDEHGALNELRALAEQNKRARSFLGLGYHEPAVPPVLQRNILENPGWYTQYTPYQAEISQGRLEALLNFQTMVTELTGLDIANASLLDESTSAAEAMMMSARIAGQKHGEDIGVFFISETCHPQTIEVVQTRAKPLGIRVVVGNHRQYDFKEKTFGVLIQYPATNGTIEDYRDWIEQARERGALVTMAADLLALTLLEFPGKLGADIAVGNTQRFGMPMGFGGPHAGFFAVRKEFQRQLPGRLVGVSKDVNGNRALRLALQTREQHIRREKATSNICTAQVLPAVVAAMYAVYHGPEGLKKIAQKIHRLAGLLAGGLRRLGHEIVSTPFFDTLEIRVQGEPAKNIITRARKEHFNLRATQQGTVIVALDEVTTEQEIETLYRIFNRGHETKLRARDFKEAAAAPLPLVRETAFLTQPVFNCYHSETEILRYLKKLENRDLSLTHSMIPLGSCTMKLNPSAGMLPVTWPSWTSPHPLAPANQTAGFCQLISQLESWLAEATGFSAVSLQPNAGSQGEYAGLLIIRRYFETRKEKQRNLCLIPASAHGTNPASAAMAGFEVVVVACEDNGNIDLGDLRQKAEQYQNRLAACMITYPSTHGVFEPDVKEICRIIHDYGGQVYLDGANMNAQVGLCSEFGADVCHLNLHKTFAIPHGGGGPGVGPVCVKEHLAEFLPKHRLARTGGKRGIGAVSQAPWGSALVLVISWMYIRMMGARGLTNATKTAILNANYIAQKLEPYFPVLYKGVNGRVAHECILDLRPFKACGVEAEDVAKRLMDYGFHAPTLSFPVPGTLMVEPTESEPKDELDRFCEAMIQIHAEIKLVESGKADAKDNPLKNAPHTAEMVASNQWPHSYSRETAAYPLPWVRENKFWPSVGRIDNVYGDRNLFCSC